ncbi:unnamed protein product [Moneuplotes crassus]|uniref:TRP C-terminal domain-containing protein n=1 Tax=Euplotes crassus TaxID=5936 RepID=A0AAD1XL82_EUPCR|nr:unnamed protein product [Moneuplotes crassus]
MKQSVIFESCFKIVVLLTMVSPCMCADGKCSSDIDKLNGAYIHQYIYQGDTNRLSSNIIISSNGLHTYGSDEGSVNAVTPTDFSNTVFYKRTQDLELVWSRQYNIVVEPGAMDLGNSDTIYFTKYSSSDCYVGKLSSSDGSILAYSQLDSAVKSCNFIAVSKDENYVYVGSNNNGDPNYIIELTSSTLSFSFAMDQSTSILFDLNAITLGGNSRSLFTISHHGTENTVFSTLTFPSTSVVNAKKFSCTVCSTSPSAKTYLTSENIAYINFINEARELFFVIDLSSMALNHAFSQASAQTSAQVTSIGILSEVSKIFMTSYHSLGTILRFFDMNTNTFSQAYSTVGKSLLSGTSYGGFIYIGNQQAGNNAVLNKLNYNDEIIKSVLIQPAVVDLAVDGTLSLGSPSITVNDQSSGRTSTVSSITSSIPTINYMSQQTLPLNYNAGSFVKVYASQNTVSSIKINMPCISDNSIGGIATGMTSYFNGSLSPIWVVSNPDLSGLIVTAPIVFPADEVSHYIGINFVYSGNTYTQYNELVIHQCYVSNCERCEYNTKYTKCTACRPGHALSLDETRCDQEFLPVQPLSLATQGFIGVGVGAGATSSLTSTASSAQGFWALINQYQLYLLFPFLKIYMPSDLEYYLTEFEIFSFNFGFIDVVEVPYINDLIEKLDYSQNSEIYSNNGYSSGAFAVNYTSMFTALFIVFICNIIFILFYAIFSKARKGGRCKKIFDWFTGFFYLTTYIRTVIEASQFAFMGALLEATTFDSFNDHTVSYLISLVFTVFMITMPVLVYLYYRKKNGQVGETLFNEFYDGTKDKKIAKLFIIFFFIRRFTTVGVLVCLRNTNGILRCAIFVPIQLAYLVYFVTVKPFEDNKDNIIEILNESIFSALSIFLSIFQDESMWVDGMSSAVIILVMANGFLISIVLIVNNIIGIVKWCKERKSKKKVLVEDTSVKVKVGNPQNSFDKASLHRSSSRNNSDEKVNIYTNKDFLKEETKQEVNLSEMSKNRLGDDKKV